MSSEKQNSPGWRPDRSKTSPPAKGTIKEKGTPGVKYAEARTRETCLEQGFSIRPEDSVIDIVAAILATPTHRAIKVGVAA